MRKNLKKHLKTIFYFILGNILYTLGFLVLILLWIVGLCALAGFITKLFDFFNFFFFFP